MKYRALAIAGMALLLPFAATACGGDDDTNSGSRPTVAEIKETLAGEAALNGAPDEFIDCLATEVESSDLPNGVLRKLVAGEEAEVDKDNEDKYTQMISDAGETCASTITGPDAGTDAPVAE